jgi:hypothetical protein
VLVAAKPKGRTGQEQADETYSAIRTRTSVAENDLVASMSRVQPLLLYGKKSELALLSEGFAACIDYDTWSGNLLSYKNQLNSYIHDFCAGLCTNLCTQGTRPRMIGYALCTNVENQWRQLCQYMDELTMELTAEAKFGKEKAWKLVSQCLAAVFEEMYEYRAKVALIEDSTTESGRAHLMWPVLQCHRILDAVLAHKFRSHPCVVRVMSLFLITEQSDPKELITMGDRVTRAESWVSEVEKAVKQVEQNKRDIGNL